MKFEVPKIADCPGCEKRRQSLLNTANKAMEWLREMQARNRSGIRPPVRSRGTIEAEIEAKKKNERAKTKNGD